MQPIHTQDHTPTLRGEGNHDSPDQFFSLIHRLTHDFWQVQALLVAAPMGTSMEVLHREKAPQ